MKHIHILLVLLFTIPVFSSDIGVPGPKDCFWSRGPHSADPYINLGIAYYDKGEHEISLDYFTKIYNNDKTHTISKNAIIKLLTFINPKKINQLKLIKSLKKNKIN